MAEKLDMHTKDLSVENIDKIAELFPNCITESLKDGKPVRSIDFDALKQELSDFVVDGPTERYQFTWPDKSKAKLLANSPINMTLRPCPEESVDFDNTKNLYIEGDNLDVLKLLRETYLGKVKMIYIDPPYNTGNDFVYNDKFGIDAKSYEEMSGDYDESGNRLELNKTSNGRFHTDWLNMIYPRLRLSRDLLTEDGAIFISIGDDEEANLIKICDEIFGESNFIASICHKSRASISNDRIISENHNHILFYAKKMDVLFQNCRMIGEDPDLSGFNSSDEKGEYKLTPVDGPGGAKKGNPHYEFLGVEGYWRYSKETMQKKYDEGLIVKTNNNLQQKYYKSQASLTRKTVTTWWDDDFLTSSATKDLIKLMGSKIFDNPKNINVLLRCLKMLTKFDKESIILDFFSGSATTAHAVMQLNSEDGGQRKFIMVQLPEKCEEISEAYVAGYRNICEIGKERIRRAGKVIQSSLAQSTFDGKRNCDVGFRVLRLDDSNMKDVYYSPDQTFQSGLDSVLDNVKENRVPMDLLFQCMLDLGIELSVPISTTKIDGKDVFDVDSEYLLACFDANVSESVVTEIAKKKPVFAVMRDSSMDSDSTATNFEQIFKSYSPTTVRKVI